MKKVSKQFFILLVGGLIFISCKNGNNTKSSNGANDSAAVASVNQEMNYPYKIDHPDYWETGSQQNTFNALSALKAWENGNIGQSLTYFADTVHVQFDGIDKKVPRDTFGLMITPNKSIKKISVKMQDWESVISKDKKEEYVTLWYRQYDENANGKKDSVDVINDIKMKDGKIIGLDEYKRKL
ncbi:MAG: hypothetical protein J0H55_13130 [Chitinophagaceae bacterium]|nr:hypothetical protein [Chitinophagaceae bacterium]